MKLSKFPTALHFFPADIITMFNLMFVTSSTFSYFHTFIYILVLKGKKSLSRILDNLGKAT